MRRPVFPFTHAVPPRPSEGTKRRDEDLLLDDGLLRLLDTLRMAAPRDRTAGLVGDHRAARRASSLEFADYRLYVPGDDIRLIDWNVYARLGDLYLKLTEARENAVVHLLIDCSASMDWGDPSKLFYAKRVAAALGAVALARDDTVLLGAFSERVDALAPPLRGRGATSTLLHYLHEIGPSSGTDLERSLADYCDRQGRRGVGILLTDFMVPEKAARILKNVTAQGIEMTAIHILDDEEVQPTLDGPVTLRDRETGEIVAIEPTPAALQRYRQALERHCSALEKTCHESGGRYTRVTTAVPLQSLLAETLRREGLLA